MRRPTAWLLAMGLVLFLAALAWGGLWLRGAFTGTQATVPCRREVMEDLVPLSGNPVREERLFTTEQPIVSLLAVSGERVAAGTPLAILCGDGEEYFRAELLLRLRRETGSPGKKDRGAALRELRACLQRRDFPALPDTARAVSVALALPEGDRAHLDGEIAALERAGAGNAIAYAPAPGIFVAGENGAAWGRLVTGQAWYFESTTSCERLAEGDPVTLRLPSGREIPAVVEGADPLTLRGDRALEELLDDAPMTLTAVLGRWEGFRLPAAALRQEEGAVYVLRVAGALNLRADVTVLCRREDEVLVASPELREGMEILIS